MNNEILHTDKPKPGTDRAFGLVFAALFGIVAFYPAFHSGGNIRLWALGLAVGFACAAALCPAILAPLNVLWFRFGVLLGNVITPVVMFILFVLVIIPFGLVMKLMKRDPLALSFDPALPSYWIKRTTQTSALDTMHNQF